jgi:RTX calcium-binding nonapeptide repeat (4 copies)
LTTALDGVMRRPCGPCGWLRSSPVRSWEPRRSRRRSSARTGSSCGRASGEEHKVGEFFGDVTSYFEAPKGIRLDIGTGRVAGGLGRDSIRGVESVVASRYDDVLRGSSGPDMIAGDTRDDFLYGLGGGDTLFGGAGDDRLVGGPDSDAAHAWLGFDHCSAERRSGCERLIRGAPK